MGKLIVFFAGFVLFGAGWPILGFLCILIAIFG